ncbi:MAG: hypothetical protein HY830_00610 [Actinobacteria bacterium]|nr:hypothetical protein [Actinomycetota bacterium]
MTGPDRDVIAALSPDERALLAWVAPQLDAAAIDTIAAADYGFDVPGHRRELTELVRSPWLPEQLIGGAAEVLALTRWTTPRDRRGHLERLFACTLLVRAATSDGDPVNSLAPLVDSAWELGEPARDAAVRYLAWCRLDLPADWRDDPTAAVFLTLAVLLLSARRATATAVAVRLVEELDAVLTDPDLPWRQRPRSPLYVRRDTDLASTRRLWSSLATRCLVDDPAVADPRLVALGRVLSGDSDTPVSELRGLLGTAP